MGGWMDVVCSYHCCIITRSNRWPPTPPIHPNTGGRSEHHGDRVRHQGHRHRQPLHPADGPAGYAWDLSLSGLLVDRRLSVCLKDSTYRGRSLDILTITHPFPRESHNPTSHRIARPNMTKYAGYILAIAFIDRIGRKRLQLIGFAGEAIVFGYMAVNVVRTLFN